MAEMSVTERDAFLREARIGVLATLDANGGPLAIPIWYERDDAQGRPPSAGMISSPYDRTRVMPPSVQPHGPGTRST